MRLTDGATLMVIRVNVELALQKAKANNDTGIVPWGAPSCCQRVRIARTSPDVSVTGARHMLDN